MTKKEMPSRDKVASRPSDRLVWLWLVIGASLLPFGHFQTIWPLAAWLSPVFLMRFSRTRRLAVGLTLIVLAECIGAAIGLRNGFIPALSSPAASWYLERCSRCPLGSIACSLVDCRALCGR